MNGISINLPVTFSGSGLPSLAWSPSQLGSALVAWFSADRNVALNGSYVSQWTDRVASIAVVQATSGQQPNFITSAQNGLPGIQNSATGATPMQLSSAAVVSALAFDRGTPFTLALAFKRGATAAHQDLMGHMDTTERGWVLGDGTSNLNANGATGNNGTLGLSFYYSSTQEFSAHGSTTLQAGSAYIAIVQYDGSGTPGGITITINKVAESMSVLNNTPGSGAFQNGNSRFYMFTPNDTVATYNNQDTILEALFMNRLATTSEQTYLDNYLNSRYAIHA